MSSEPPFLHWRPHQGLLCAENQLDVDLPLPPKQNMGTTIRAAQMECEGGWAAGGLQAPIFPGSQGVPCGGSRRAEHLCSIRPSHSGARPPLAEIHSSRSEQPTGQLASRSA